MVSPTGNGRISSFRTLLLMQLSDRLRDIFLQFSLGIELLRCSPGEPILDELRAPNAACVCRLCTFLLDVNLRLVFKLRYRAPHGFLAAEHPIPWHATDWPYVLAVRLDGFNLVLCERLSRLLNFDRAGLPKRKNFYFILKLRLPRFSSFRGACDDA